MKRKLILGGIFLIVIFSLLYSIAWFVVVGLVSSSLNQKYSHKYIDINNEITAGEQKYLIKFAKIVPYGFPFKIGWKIVGWQEEATNSVIEFYFPIYLGYDLIKQMAFISYSGEATGSYKPVNLKFGIKFHSKESSLTAQIPLSYDMLKVFIFKKSLFELINFINKLELKFDKTQIFDLFDQTKLYEEDYTTISFSFEKNKYYTSLEDFKNNSPQKVNIDYSTKILESNLQNRKIPAGILLYRLLWPFSFSFDGKLSIKTNKTTFDEFNEDLEITIKNAKTTSQIQDSTINILCQKKVHEKGETDFFLNVNSIIDWKLGASDKVINFINTLLPAASAFLKDQAFVSEWKYISQHKDNFNFADLENRRYNFDIDTNYNIKENKITQVKMNNLSLYSNNTGFSVSNESKFDRNMVSKGKSLIINYQRLLPVFTNYIFNLGQFKSFSAETKLIYQEATKSFFKTISDYPKSTSDDISIEYTIDLNDFNSSKIGTMSIEHIVPIYYLELYRQAKEKIEVDNNDKKIISEKIIELVPAFKDHQKLLQQFLAQTF